MSDRLPTSAEDILIQGLIDMWLPGAELSPNQWWKLRRSLIRIGSALGVVDELARQPFLFGTIAYQGAVIRNTVDALVRGLVGARPAYAGPFAFVATGGRAVEIPGILPATVVDGLDVNAASAVELAGLPGLGPVSARRVVVYRAVHGPYADLDEVRRASRVRRDAFDRAAVRLQIGDGRPAPAEPADLVLVQAEGLAGFLRLWSEGQIRAPQLQAATPVGALLELGEIFAAHLALSPAVPRLWSPSRGRLQRGSQAIATNARLRAGAAADVRVGPVLSAGYLPVLLALIDAATVDIVASMFYFTAGPHGGGSHPGNRVVAALERAVARGVDVRLILDDDLPSDRHGAGLVNESTFALLADRGIPFRREHLEVTSHAKMIIVDGRHVLLGSHNWTAPSFFRYQETSCYLQSDEFGDRVRGLLNRRWQLLAPAGERIVPVELLEILPATTRAAVVVAGLADGPDFVAATHLEAQRLALQEPLGLPEPEIDRARRVVGLMQAFRISEIAAVALVSGGLDTPDEVELASTDELRAALSTQGLPEPFGLRLLLPEFVDWLAEQES